MGEYKKALWIVLLILTLSGCSQSSYGEFYCTSNQVGTIVLDDNHLILLSGNKLLSFHLSSDPALELLKNTDCPWTTSIGEVNGILYGAYNNNGIVEVREISLTNPADNSLKARIVTGIFDQGEVLFYDDFFYFIMAENTQFYLTRVELENINTTDILRTDSGEIEKLCAVTNSEQSVSEIHNMRVCDNKIMIYGIVHTISEYYYTISIYDPETKVLETLPVTSLWRMAGTTKKICSVNHQGAIDVYDIKTQQVDTTFFPKSHNKIGGYEDLSCDRNFIYVSYSQPGNTSTETHFTEIYDYQGNYITEISTMSPCRYICSTRDYVLFGELTSPDPADFYIAKKSDFKQKTVLNYFHISVQ